MAGTAKNYVVAQIMQGPADHWIIGTAPVDGTPRVTLDAATLTPDATAHPSSIHLGLTEGDSKIHVAAKLKDIGADQFAGVLDQYNEQEGIEIDTVLTQMEAITMQQVLSGISAYSTASGYKQNTFGGLNLPAKVCYAIIAPKRNDATKAHVCVLFSAIIDPAIAVNIGRKNQSKYALKVKGLVDPTRTAGKQIGNLYETI